MFIDLIVDMANLVGFIVKSVAKLKVVVAKNMVLTFHDDLNLLELSNFYIEFKIFFISRFVLLNYRVIFKLGNQHLSVLPIILKNNLKHLNEKIKSMQMVLHAAFCCSSLANIGTKNGRSARSHN